MAKMQKIENIVDWKFNINQLVKDEETCRILIQIRQDEIHRGEQYIDEKIENELMINYNSIFNNESDKKQIGKVWILVKQLENEKHEVLQVAQALEYKWKENKGYWNELRNHVYSIILAAQCNNSDIAMMVEEWLSCPVKRNAKVVLSDGMVYI